MKDIKHYYEHKRKAITQSIISKANDQMYIVNSYKMIDDALNNPNTVGIYKNNAAESMNKNQYLSHQYYEQLFKIQNDIDLTKRSLSEEPVIF